MAESAAEVEDTILAARSRARRVRSPGEGPFTDGVKKTKGKSLSRPPDPAHLRGVKPGRAPPTRSHGTIFRRNSSQSLWRSYRRTAPKILFIM